MESKQETEAQKTIVENHSPFDQPTAARRFISYFADLYRDKFTKQFDHYDTIESGKSASLAGSCVFCDMVVNASSEKTKQNIWYEDDAILIFGDIRPGAAVHGLCIPKRHIRDIKHLRKEDIELLKSM